MLLVTGGGGGKGLGEEEEEGVKGKGSGEPKVEGGGEGGVSTDAGQVRPWSCTNRFSEQQDLGLPGMNISATTMKITNT